MHPKAVHMIPEHQLCYPQVGSPQLKLLQDQLQSCDGVFGARFSGAGTRGACVALVHADATELVAAKVSCKLYSRSSSKKTGSNTCRCCPWIGESHIVASNGVAHSGSVLAQVMQAYAKAFPHLADAAQVIVSSSSNGARFLTLQ